MLKETDGGASLHDLIEASYKSQKDAREQLGRFGYTYDPSLSRMDTKVFLNEQGEPIILHRGSVRVSDWMPTNIALAGGLEQYTPRFKHATDITQKVKEKYKDKEITSIGHSLGGSLAEKTGADKVITYNKPITPFDIGKHLSLKQFDIRSKYDPVSFLTDFQFGKYKKQVAENIINPLKAHTLDALPKYLKI
jgi:hypothetical protein